MRPTTETLSTHRSLKEIENSFTGLFSQKILAKMTYSRDLVNTSFSKGKTKTYLKVIFHKRDLYI